MPTQNLIAAVIIPVHNAAAFLPACLDAVAAQAFPAEDGFCCIMVDDASTDESAALCDARAAQDPRFAVHHREICGGVSAARADGVRLAQQRGAAYLAFCDADDLYEPNFLASLYGAATELEQPVACCRYDSFGADSASAHTAGGPIPAAEALASPAHLDALLHDHGVDYSLCNKLYRADVLTPELLDNGFAFNEDLLANWQIFSAIGGIAFLDHVLYHYRQHAQSASHRPLLPESIDEQRRAALYIREHAPEGLQQSADAFYYEKLVYLSSMILRRADAPGYYAQMNELAVGITAGLGDPNLGRNPRLPFAIKCAALATVRTPKLWRKICRRFLKDRQ